MVAEPPFEPVREFFDMEVLSSTQWFLALFSAATGLTLAAVLWRLPQIKRWELSVSEEETDAPPLEREPVDLV